MPKDVYRSSRSPKSNAFPMSAMFGAGIAVVLIVAVGLWWLVIPHTPPASVSTAATPQQQSDNAWISEKLKSTGGVWSKLSPDEQQRADAISKGHGRQVFSN